MLLGRGPHPAAAAGDLSEDGIATVVIGERENTERGIVVSNRRCLIDLGAGFPQLKLRPPFLSPEEVAEAALLLRREAEPVAATGMPASIERSGFAAYVLTVPEPAAPVRLSVVEAPERLPESRDEADRPDELAQVTDPRPEAIPARRLFCFGRVRVEVNGEVVEGRWRAKSTEFLALLAAHPEGTVKNAVLEALWPEGDPDKSDQNLRQCRVNIRKHMGVEEGHDVIERVDESCV